MALKLKEKDGYVTFEVRVQPRASRSEIAGEHDGALKIRVTAPPLDGRANEECIRVLAKTLKVPAGTIEIVSGKTSRTKVVRVQGVSADRLRELFSPLDILR